jgi:hypothetical protein
VEKTTKLLRVGKTCVLLQQNQCVMQLVDSKGNVIVEREKTQASQARMSSVRTRRMSKGLKKTVRPVLMSKEQFFNTILQNPTNGNL